MTLMEKIEKCVEEGILGHERVPTEQYWHWPVLKPDLLFVVSPALFAAYRRYGEIRWYGGESE